MQESYGDDVEKLFFNIRIRIITSHIYTTARMQHSTVCSGLQSRVDANYYFLQRVNQIIVMKKI